MLQTIKSLEINGIIIKNQDLFENFNVTKIMKKLKLYNLVLFITVELSTVNIENYDKFQKLKFYLKCINKIIEYETHGIQYFIIQPFKNFQTNKYYLSKTFLKNLKIHTENKNIQIYLNYTQTLNDFKLFSLLSKYHKYANGVILEESTISNGNYKSLSSDMVIFWQKNNNQIDLNQKNCQKSLYYLHMLFMPSFTIIESYCFKCIFSLKYIVI